MKKILISFLFSFLLLLMGGSIHAEPGDSIRTAINDGHIRDAGGYLWFARAHKCTKEDVLATEDGFLDLSPSKEHIEDYAKKYGKWIKIRYEIKQGRIRDAGGYLWYVKNAGPEGALNRATRAALRRSLLENTIEDFLALSPQIDHLVEFDRKLEEVYYKNGSYPYLLKLLLRKYGLENIKLSDASQFIRLVKLERIQGYQTWLLPFLREQLDLFWKLKPTNVEVCTLGEALPHLRADLFGHKCKELELAVESGKVTTPQQYLQFLEGLGRENPMDPDLQARLISDFITLSPKVEQIIELGKHLEDKDLLFDSCSEYKAWILSTNLERFVLLKETALGALIPPSFTSKKQKIVHYVQDTFEREYGYFKNRVEGLIDTAEGQLAELKYHEQEKCVQETKKAVDKLIKEATSNYERMVKRCNRGGHKSKWLLPSRIADSPQLADVDEIKGESSASSSVQQDECPLCWDKFDDSQQDKNKVTVSCGHFACSECFKKYIKTAVEENKLSVRCFGGCNTPLKEVELRQGGLTQNQLSRWESHRLRMNVPGSIECPREDCHQVLVPVKGYKSFLCNRCSIEVCGKCHQSAHPTEPCVDPKSGLKRLEKKKIVQCCPKCKAPTIRTAACSHMDCTQCGERWNYRGRYRENLDRKWKLHQ